MVVNVIVCYCYIRERYTRKMLNETETEETIGFFDTFLSLVAFQLGEGTEPLGYGYGWTIPFLRHCARATQLLSTKSSNGGEPLATVCGLTGPRFEPKTSRSRDDRVTV